MNKLLYLSLCALLKISLVKGEEYTSVVETGSGPVRGFISSTIEDVEYAAFKGIPYAKPPVDDLRFKPPVEIDAWTDVYDATTEGSVCPQFNSAFNNVMGSEDCLYINVFTPHIKFDGSLSKPVMVWIYGGAFSAGSSNQFDYGPDFILGQDVIMVSFNYRLGALGFLNLEHENATGNSGLKDQTLALKWVKKNIAQFGGNPDNITIFGQSAGSASVDLHVLSDMSVGLFQQSIAMSGSPLCLYWALQSTPEAIEVAFQLGSNLGTKTSRKSELLKALYDASAADIVLASKDTSMLQMPFRPTIERADIAMDQEKFLTECPLQKYINGNYTKGPHMMGFTANETIFFAESVEDLSKMYISLLDTSNNKTRLMSLLSDLKKAIDTGENNMAMDATINILKEATDLLFVFGIDTKQKLISRNNDFPIYYYRFSFSSNYSVYRAFDIDVDGVGHGNDVPYILYTPLAGFPQNQPDIASVRQKYVKLWTNFAKYGNPTPASEDDKVLRITWPDSRPRGEHLEIGETLTVGPRPTDSLVKELQTSKLDASLTSFNCKNKSIDLFSIIEMLG